MRFGEDAQKVIERVKQRITDIEPTLPKGLKIVNTYDRSDLIDRSVDNLKHTLVEELVIVSLVIMIFLWHFPSAFIPIITIPVTVIIAFIPIQMSGMSANIMSLGGIAIAIGAMPGMSVTEAARLLQVQDKIIKSFPEVERVFGKAGRVESATDPAPYSMMETVIILKPHMGWPKRERSYSKWAPNWLQTTTRSLVAGPHDHPGTDLWSGRPESAR
jgi:Cu/Ag efflux pump CusA